jgi:AraC-like DNA-binding protein
MSAAPASLPHVVVGSDPGLSPLQRYERFRWMMSNNAEVSSASPDSFDMSSTVWQLGSAVVLSCTFPELTLRRTSALVRALDSDRYLLRVNRRTGMGVDTDNQRVRVTAGQVLLTDASRPETIYTNAGPHMTLSLPRDEVDRILARSLDLNGIVLQGACGQLLASHLLGIEDRLDKLTPREVDGVVSSVLHLLGASVAPSINSLGLARPAIEQSLLRQARNFVESNIQSPALGPEALSAYLKISRSTLYRIFAPLGGVAGYVRERRLAHVHALLTSKAPLHGRIYLARIAEDYGFPSASHFSRVFREHYGFAPREAQEAWPRPEIESSATSRLGGNSGKYGEWNFTGAAGQARRP